MNKRITISITMPLALLMAVALSASGCATTAPGDALDAMLQATLEGDCETAASYVDLEASSARAGVTFTRDYYLEDCRYRHTNWPLHDYRITDYRLEGDTAYFEVEFHSIINGVKTSGANDYTVVKSGDQWKVIFMDEQPEF